MTGALAGWGVMVPSLSLGGGEGKRTCTITFCACFFLIRGIRGFLVTRLVMRGKIVV